MRMPMQTTMQTNHGKLIGIISFFSTWITIEKGEKCQSRVFAEH